MRFLIVGAKGQLRSEFARILKDKNKTLLALGKEESDVTNFKQVVSVFENFKPQIVINCSAYNQVDKAEEDKPNPLNEYGKSKLLGENLSKKHLKTI